MRPGQKTYIPALQTLAMGDVNAVEFGQQAHVKLAISAGVCLSDLLTWRGRLQGGVWILRAPSFLVQVISLPLEFLGVTPEKKMDEKYTP